MAASGAGPDQRATRRIGDLKLSGLEAETKLIGASWSKAGGGC
jgi:hypothetical protein